jgi:hypothetical protein
MRFWEGDFDHLGQVWRATDAHELKGYTLKTRLLQGCYGVQSTPRCHLSTLGAINDVEKNSEHIKQLQIVF